MYKRRNNLLAAEEHRSKAAELARKPKEAKWLKIYGQLLAREFGDFESCKYWFQAAEKLRQQQNDDVEKIK